MKYFNPKYFFLSFILLPFFSFSQFEAIPDSLQRNISRINNPVTNCHDKSKKPFSKKIVRDLRTGRLTEDTSFAYWLPYKEKTVHKMIQGYYGLFWGIGTHHGVGSLALDFKMDIGTKVYAVRGGIVIKIVDAIQGRGDSGNHIIIKHEDGSRVRYDHLMFKGVLVNRGDSIKAGQEIALSGQTGQARVPHLHLIFYKCNETGYYSIPTRFLTKKGAAYIFKRKKYISVRP